MVAAGIELVYYCSFGEWLGTRLRGLAMGIRYLDSTCTPVTLGAQGGEGLEGDLGHG